MLRVHILGAGTPVPAPGRFGSSQVVQVDDDLLMFDCGPAATHKLVKAGLWPTDVNHLFFTHHHFDHTADYPCLLLCRWDQGAGRERPLQVYGPPPTVHTTEALIGDGGVYWPDIQARVNHPASHAVYEGRGGVLPRVPPRVQARDIEPGAVVRGSSWEVRATTAVHVQPWLDSLAYRVDTPYGSVVVTGDTGPCEAVSDLARGADLLLCMCWDIQEEMDPDEAVSMCGSLAAAEMAEEAGVGNLILVHNSPRVDRAGGRELLLADAARRFGGSTVVADEGMGLTLGGRGGLAVSPGFDAHSVPLSEPAKDS